jgi:succinyl-CoA synthetase alpha subunit
VIVQGITGRFGSLHARQMKASGTNVVAGVTPGKAGESVDGIPVYGRVADAVNATSARASVLFVPAPALLSAAVEAIEGGIRFLVPITEHVPFRDTLKLMRLAESAGAMVVGPNTAGLIVPPLRLKLGIMPDGPFSRGSVAIFSRSGSLMYEVADSLTRAGIGQYIALGVGGDPVTCTTLAQCFEWASDASEVNGVVVVGEIGGDAEERLAEHINLTGFRKPVVGLIVGRSAPKEKRMGHAGAIIYGDYGTADSKIAALRAAGVRVAMTASEVPALVRASLSSAKSP